MFDSNFVLDIRPASMTWAWYGGSWFCLWPQPGCISLSVYLYDIYLSVAIYLYLSMFDSNFVLDISDGFHDMGVVRWQLVLSLVAAWVVVGICLIRGIKSSGKVRTIFSRQASLTHIGLSLKSYLKLIAPSASQKKNSISHSSLVLHKRLVYV